MGLLLLLFVLIVSLNLSDKINCKSDSIMIDNNTNHLNNSNSSNVHHSETFKVIDWKFEELKNYIIFAFFIIVVVLMKAAYHRIPKISNYIPESCLLLIIGIIFGVLIKFILKRENVIYFKLTPELFFYVLLPPIILESSYFLFHRNFLDNLLAVLIFAVFGTLLNFLIIGFALFGFAQVGLMKKLELSLLHCLLFSSLIVAVDPVAVLAIFNEVGVNEDLYYLVFGESLLNDAVTVVLYEMMQEFALMKEIGAKNIVLGIVSFFTVSFGGMIIGIVFGILSCLVIRFMDNKHTIFLEPILLIGMGYLSYLIGDLFGWSGIISIIACGLVQAAYALQGIGEKTNLVLKKFVKIIASISEPIIFLFLGVEIVIGEHSWEISFIMCALLLCLGARFVVIFCLSGIINFIHMSIRNIPMQEKFIISYGGLRGAVAFSLAVLIKPQIFNSSLISKETIISTTLIIILFTIIVQGMTIKPLVKCLQISKVKKDNKISLFNELNESVLDAANKAIEGIMGNCGRYYILTQMEHFSSTYLRPFLQGKGRTKYVKLVEMNEKISEIILSSMLTDSAHNQMHRLPHSYKNLLTVMENPQMKPDTVVPMRPVFHRAISDATEKNPTKPLKRLKQVLYRASAINVDEWNDWYKTQPHAAETCSYTKCVHKAKYKWLEQLQRNKEPIEEVEESSLLKPSVEEKLKFRAADEFEEETGFY